jgi:hypothetical protein
LLGPSNNTASLDFQEAADINPSCLETDYSNIDWTNLVMGESAEKHSSDYHCIPLSISLKIDRYGVNTLDVIPHVEI